MTKNIARFLSFLFFFFIVASSARAQFTPCGWQSMTGISQQNYPATPCPGTTQYLQNFSQAEGSWYCYDITNGNATYASYSPTIYGYGITSYQPYCAGIPTNCWAVTNEEDTQATSVTDYNRFYLRAYDVSLAKYTFSTSCPQTGVWRQAFWQCSPLGDCTNLSTGGGPPCYVDGSCADGPSPIVIDVAGNGFALTNAANGVQFDITGTGKLLQMGWTAPGASNAFLALPGADGLVHNGQQLFGNFTPQPKSATPNGFAALAVYDQPANGGNGDGVIDARDAVFASLRLWIDMNHDGISQPEELHTLPSLGVNSISLNYKIASRTDQFGNVFRYRAQVNPGDTTSTGRIAYDVFFVTPNSPTAKNTLNPEGRKCRVPAIKAGLLATAGGSR